MNNPHPRNFEMALPEHGVDIGNRGHREDVDATWPSNRASSASATSRPADTITRQTRGGPVSRAAPDWMQHPDFVAAQPRKERPLPPPAGLESEPDYPNVARLISIPASYPTETSERSKTPGSLDAVLPRRAGYTGIVGNPAYDALAGSRGGSHFQDSGQPPHWEIGRPPPTPHAYGRDPTSLAAPGFMAAETGIAKRPADIWFHGQSDPEKRPDPYNWG